MKRPTRYRLFFWLLDAATFVTSFSLGRYLANPERILGGGSDTAPMQVLSALAVLLPAILIFVRFIRDEFAEQLWQAAAGATLRGLIWIPLLMFPLWGLFAGFSGASTINPDAVISGSQMFGLMLMLQLTLFVLSLQWNRWKATRG